MIHKSCLDFRKVLARIFFLQFVAQTFNIDMESGTQRGDNESLANNQLLMEDGDKKKMELSENLVGNMAQTSLRIIGGTVKLTEVH